METKVNKAKPNVSVMKAAELLGRIKKETPEFLSKMPEKKAAGIISAVLVQLGKQLDAVKEGVVKVQGLGRFRIQLVEREKDGKKEKVRRILFGMEKPKAQKGNP